MGLKASYATKDEAPEAIRDFLVEKLGRWVLDVEGMIEKSRLDEFRKNNLELNDQVKELKGQVERFEGVDPDRAREAMKKLRQLEDKQHIDQGNIDELIEKRATEQVAGFRQKAEAEIENLKKAVEKLTGEREQLGGKLKEITIDQTVRNTAARRGVQPKSLSLLSLMASKGDDKGRRWDLNESGDPVALKPDGSPEYSAREPGKPLPLDEWVDQILESHDYLRAPSTGGGASGGNGGPSREGRRVRWGDQEAMSRNLEDIASGKVEVVIDQ